MKRHFLSIGAILVMVILAFGSVDSSSDTGGGSSGAGGGSSESESILGKNTIKGDTWIGCISREDHDQLTRYVAAGDREAFGRLLTEGLATGDCVEFESGETVYVSDVSVMSAAVKVRREGESQEYWAAIECVQ